MTVGGDGALSAPYDALIAWEERALQSRFSGIAQYLKSARKLCERRACPNTSP